MARPGAWGKFCLPTIHAVLLVASPYIMCQGIVLDVMHTQQLRSTVHEYNQDEAGFARPITTGWVMSVPLGEGNYR